MPESCEIKVTTRGKASMPPPSPQGYGFIREPLKAPGAATFHSAYAKYFGVNGLLYLTTSSMSCRSLAGQPPQHLARGGGDPADSRRTTTSGHPCPDLLRGRGPSKSISSLCLASVPGREVGPVGRWPEPFRPLDRPEYRRSDFRVGFAPGTPRWIG